MTVQHLLQIGTDRLKESLIENPRLECEWLLSEFLHCRQLDLILNAEMEMDLGRVEEFLGWVERRSSGEPFAYIVGFRDFYRSRFIVGPGVLIPRPDTELLVEFGVHWLTQEKFSDPKIIDFGCGSGCIGLSLIKECGGQLLGIDASQDALEYARKNAEALGLDDRVHFAQVRVQDIPTTNGIPWDRWRKANLIAANPPYIGMNDPHLDPKVREFEPHLALFGGKSGLEEMELWLAIMLSFLDSGGKLLIEHGANQSSEVIKMMEKENQFEGLESYRDLAGWDRLVVGTKKR